MCGIKRVYKHKFLQELKSRREENAQTQTHTLSSLYLNLSLSPRIYLSVDTHTHLPNHQPTHTHKTRFTMNRKWSGCEFFERKNEHKHRHHHKNKDKNKTKFQSLLTITSQPNKFQFQCQSVFAWISLPATSGAVAKWKVDRDRTHTDIRTRFSCEVHALDTT